jgi:hypothetical protein
MYYICPDFINAIIINFYTGVEEVNFYKYARAGI